MKTGPTSYTKLWAALVLGLAVLLAFFKWNDAGAIDDWLGQASERGYLIPVKALITIGADVNARDRRHETAAELGHNGTTGKPEDKGGNEELIQRCKIPNIYIPG